MKANRVIIAFALVVAAAARGGAQTLVNETADVSANTAGLYTSIALDAAGSPHVSYFDNTATDLKYARKSEGVWTIETPDGSANNVGSHTSLALDASGNPHASYRDATAGSLKYARKLAGAWTIEAADGSVNDVGWYTSLALDASGNPHVSYWDATVGNLKYARKSGGVWALETADGSANVVGAHTSIALDAAGNPHVSYFDATTGDLKYARKSGGAWTRETADASANDVGYYSSLALDASSNPHVSYFDNTTGDLRYARKASGIWTIETADGSAHQVGWYTSLALDGSGNPHVSYTDATTDDLRYARKLGGVWTREIADGLASQVGWYTSLALDASGIPHMSYHDVANSDVKYAYVPRLVIVAPQPGVTWAVGSVQTIRWSFTGGLPVDNSDVYLSLDGGSSFTQIRNEARDPEMTLRVPHSPTPFASIKIVRPSPYTEAYMDSFFTIDATIALNKFEVRVVGDGSASANASAMETSLATGAPRRAVQLAWRTTPGRDAEIRYRVERSTGGSGASEFVPLTPDPLDADEYLDTGADVGGDGGESAPASAMRYRLIAINGLGEQYALGEVAAAPPLGWDASLTTYPNPARDGRVHVVYRVPFNAFDGGAARRDAAVSIYDASGRQVRRLASGALASGLHSATWDGTNDAGEPVPSGVYFARLSWDGAMRATERVVVVR